METLVFPLKTKNRSLTQLYGELLRDDIQLIAIDKTILSTAEIRATTHLKTPAAIHIATALNIGCNLFLTNDAGLQNVRLYRNHYAGVQREHLTVVEKAQSLANALIFLNSLLGLHSANDRP